MISQADQDARDAVRRTFRRLRAGADLSQLETERLARLTKGRFWKLENGFEVATDAERESLARVLHCTPAEIPGGPAVADEVTHG